MFEKKVIRWIDGSEKSDATVRDSRRVNYALFEISRVANPYDNAKAEEVNGKAYATLDQARRDIGRFIDTVFNTQRLHSALGYKPPAEFEAELRQPTNQPNYAMIVVSPN
jgi:transposase InsO family protein